MRRTRVRRSDEFWGRLVKDTLTFNGDECLGDGQPLHPLGIGESPKTRANFKRVDACLRG